MDSTELIGGCIISKKDIRDYKIKSEANVTYPGSYEIQFTHNIKHQGNVGSCVAHSASEILEYYSHIPMSTNFIYSLKRAVANELSPGMSLATACKIVKEYGDLTEEDCPGNIEVPECFKQESKFLSDMRGRIKAYQYRIDSYYLCEDDNDIKFALMNYGPVLVAVKWYKRYGIIGDNQIFFDTTTSFGYHAVMVYGWNETGWLIQNSWGTDFGKNGCAILPYKYGIAEARCLIDHDNTKKAGLLKPTTIPKCLVKITNKVINKFSPRK